MHKRHDHVAMGASSVHNEAIENMKDQLLIVLINRLGGMADVPVNEIDATGTYLLNMRLDTKDKVFKFEVTKKQ